MKHYLYHRTPNHTRKTQVGRFRSALLSSSLIVQALLIASSSAMAQGAPSLALPPSGPPNVSGVPSALFPAQQQANTPPPPPVATTVTSDKPLLGAPFPSMAQTQKPIVPLSNQPLGISTERTAEDMQQLQKQTADRMNELRNGTGLGNPDVSAYGTELQEMAAIQRRTRMLQAKRQEAEAAIAVYGVLYDSRREEEAAKKAKEVKEKEEKEAKDKTEKEEKAKIAASLPPVPQVVQTPGLQPQNTVVNGQPQTLATVVQEMPLPKIVSVAGTGGNLKATLLVPYVGEISAITGTVLPGDRKVVSISNTGVVIKDPKLGNLSLGYGDSVPAAPPVPAAQAGARPGFPLALPPPMPFPTMPTMPPNNTPNSTVK